VAFAGKTAEESVLAAYVEIYFNNHALPNNMAVRAFYDIRMRLIGLCDAFNAHDLDRIMAFFADEGVLEMPKGSQPWRAHLEGRNAERQGLASRFDGLPDRRRRTFCRR
jgi:hypothetical protein